MHAIRLALRRNPIWPDLIRVVSHTDWSRPPLPPLAIHFLVKLHSSIPECRPGRDESREEKGMSGSLSCSTDLLFADRAPVLMCCWQSLCFGFTSPKCVASAARILFAASPCAGALAELPECQ